ncbi:amidohydrolase family protein [Corynebacterium uberis]|uniref:N-acetylglucosamine-6-phosphate deacetylase n=1 Tax=Corynebacterium TaxID=1716 RepID=UPI001D09E3C0|nr:amidohydrolase family protein [Corynebacterium uberis]MCZ9309802.1 amidohydrolase family protein [Corynebacterium sp. c6VSa_13]UDL73600.1 amidohydrolase family protein [Corynebacterium uberis]UDL75520.1 amidohydrolase family protein [Corynebacterium uberis]UDL77733.1 amidohydrolase family protein [Corynebacterium uberis]UDL80017.1 amidohydrolase family protein [Corynebacterium uberis]
MNQPITPTPDGMHIHAHVLTATTDVGPARITVTDGTITAITPTPDLTPAAAADLPLAVPGFVDLHNHGGARGAFPTGTLEQCRTAAAFHRDHGTTTLLASLVSGTEDELTSQVQVLTELVDSGEIAGIHLEGPFINACRCGAQAPTRIQPGDPDMLARIIDASLGTVRQITFAPETPHAAELLAVCADNGVIASLGHSDADYDTTRAVLDRAAELGVTVTATHLFNAMPPLHHRDPGIAAALIEAAAEGRTWVELIADGVHLADGTVDMVTAAVGDHALAVTDAMEAAGMPDGSYILGPLDVTVAGGVARLSTSDATPGAIAGGTTTLLDQFHRYRARHGGPAAVRLTSTNAAAALGLDGEAGDLRPGMPATLVLIAPSGAPAAVIVDGAVR